MAAPDPLSKQPQLPLLRDPVNAATYRELQELRTFCNLLLDHVATLEERIETLENP